MIEMGPQLCPQEFKPPELFQDSLYEGKEAFQCNFGGVTPLGAKWRLILVAETRPFLDSSTIQGAFSRHGNQPKF